MRRARFDALRFISELPIRRPLPRRNLVQRPALRLRPHMGVAREHRARDVPGDTHDHFVAGARFRKFRDQRVAVIVPASL